MFKNTFLTRNDCLSFISSPTKITLIGAVLFALQHTGYLPLQKHHLMLFYTIFTVANKVSLPPHVTPASLKGLEASPVMTERVRRVRTGTSFGGGFASCLRRHVFHMTSLARSLALPLFGSFN